MKKHLPHIGICLAMVALLSFGFLKSEKTKEANNEERAQNTIQNKWETKTDERSPVSITITPRALNKEAETWEFDIAFDTHAGSLDDDPLEVVVLRDDKGNEYRPISWNGPGPGGHHREGILVFDAVKGATSVELKVKNVGEIPERVFQWNVK